MPVISIIVPIFNQEAYLRTCLSSLRHQRCDDIEVLMVDDGSTDSSSDIIDEFADHDPRFRAMHQSNSGVSSARNAGLGSARGEWVSFVDPDDYLDEDFLTVLLRAADEHPDADVIMSTCVAFDDEGERRQRFYPGSFVATDERSKHVLYRQLMDGSYSQPRDFVTAIGVPWGKLYRRTFLDEHELNFNVELPRMQDNLFNMAVFHDARELVYLDYAGYHYRMSGLGERTYRNTARGLYHPAIDERARLMHAYGLDADDALRRAWNVEQVNLYYQELKAVAMLSDPNLRTIRQACRMRARELRNRMETVDAGTLPRAIRLKYAMLTRPMMTDAASLMFLHDRR